MAEPAEAIATLEGGCLCRLQFAQEHPNHAFLGPCVHEQLAEATAAQSALKAELAEARGAPAAAPDSTSSPTNTKGD